MFLNSQTGNLGNTVAMHGYNVDLSGESIAPGQLSVMSSVVISFELTD